MRLISSRCEGGYLFSVEGNPKVGPATWPTHELALPTGSPADVTAIIDVFTRERAEQRPDNCLFVPDEEIAGMSGYDVKALGLPEPAQVSLSIRTQGNITAPDFELNYGLLDHQGRKWLGVQRDGVLLSRGGRSFTLLNPLYNILDQLDAFASLPTDHQSRFSHWAEIQKLLPDDVKLDGQLSSLRIASSERIGLDILDDSDFDPLPLASTAAPESEADELALPPHFFETFKRQFRRFERAHKTYALGEGHYLMFSERARDALNVIREFQRKPVEERRAFVANPQKYIEGEPAVRGDDNAEPEIFVETPQFLSARIKELGQWSPKVGAFVKSSGTDWLPGEDIEIAFTVGDSTYRADLDEFIGLEERINLAEAQGESTVTIGGNTVPITEELKAEAARIGRKVGEVVNKDEQNRTGKVHVPVLFDNIESLEFSADTKQGRAGVFQLPKGLKTTSLYPHQETGLRWLVDHWIVGNPGALLADDMGLGKTLQTLAFLAWVQEGRMAQSKTTKPHLIVAPTGLLKNWIDEVAMHLHATGLGDLVEVFGAGTTSLKRASPSERRELLSNAGWVLTTYETLRDQIQWFMGVPWWVSVFDEAQKIKNPAARVTEMAKSLQSDFTLLLTGTPVENSLADLWCIMDAAHAGLLGAQRDFVKEYVKSEQALENAKELKVRLQDSDPPTPMLRRMKEDHLDGLPVKAAEVRERLMSDTQAKAYDEAIILARSSKGKNGVLEAIQKLKSVSLIGRCVDDNGLDDEAIASSARLQQTLDILDAINEKGEKALIFLESIELQKRLAPYLQRRYNLPETPLRISGEINGMLRKSYVDRFQKLPKGQFAVMILSPKAGGVGLTLTAANHVIHLSRWWNPAVEDQCTDRVYRIGQEKPVTVWYPLATHPRFGEKSFDWNLHRLLEKKRALSRSALIGQVDPGDLELLLGESLSQ